MEVTSWFYPTQRVLIALFANKFIVKSKFVVDYLQHLKVLEFKRKIGKQKINHTCVRIILGLSCATNQA